jgi:hypothetical protein
MPDGDAGLAAATTAVGILGTGQHDGGLCGSRAGSGAAVSRRRIIQAGKGVQGAALREDRTPAPVCRAMAAAAGRKRFPVTPIESATIHHTKGHDGLSTGSGSTLARECPGDYLASFPWHPHGDIEDHHLPAGGDPDGARRGKDEPGRGTVTSPPSSDGSSPLQPRRQPDAFKWKRFCR